MALGLQWVSRPRSFHHSRLAPRFEAVRQVWRAWEPPLARKPRLAHEVQQAREAWQAQELGWAWVRQQAQGSKQQLWGPDSLFRCRLQARPLKKPARWQAQLLQPALDYETSALRRLLAGVFPPICAHGPD